jgi:hypothetical protein
MMVRAISEYMAVQAVVFSANAVKFHINLNSQIFRKLKYGKCTSLPFDSTDLVLLTGKSPIILRVIIIRTKLATHIST